MANLDRDANLFLRLRDRDPIQTVGDERPQEKLVVRSDLHRMRVGMNVQHVQRLRRAEPQALALSHREAVNTLMMSQNLTTRGDSSPELSGSSRPCSSR